MSELRDRIAQVLHRRFGPSLGASHDGWDREPKATQDMYREDAAEVMMALGLTLERSEWPFDGKYRYVTEWQPDE